MLYRIVVLVGVVSKSLYVIALKSDCNNYFPTKVSVLEALRVLNEYKLIHFHIIQAAHMLSCANIIVVTVQIRNLNGIFV